MLKRRFGLVLLVLLVAGLIAAGCAVDGRGTATAMPQATAKPQATATPVPPTATVTPSPTPTTTPEPTQVAFNPVFTSAPCPFSTPMGAVVDCGFAVVPEDRDGALSDTIRLAVAVYRSTSAHPAPDPVIFLQGGPGGSALSWTAAAYSSFIVPLLEERDVIILDQRGAGFSEPSLDCGELKLLALQDILQPLPAEERPGRYKGALEACRDRVIANGANPAAYTSAASAADVKDVVALLGYEQVNLYAVSYGTRVAQIVMRDFPVVVRSAVLDSVLPLPVKLYNVQGVGSNEALNKLFASCAADPACSEAYPDLQATYVDLVAQLDANPLSVEVKSPLDGQLYPLSVDGGRLANAIVWGLHSSHWIPFLPEVITGVRDGDMAYLTYLLTMPLLSYNDLSLGVMLSSDCHEQVFATTPEELEASLVNPEARGYGLTSFYTGDVLFPACELWGAAPYDAREAKPLVSDIPTLVIAGEYDPTTPPGFGRELAATLGQHYFYEFPGQGHTPSLSSPSACPLSIAVAFLHDPGKPPEDACLDAMDGVAFVVPFSAEKVQFAPFTDESDGITGILPRGWKAAGMGFYNRAASSMDPTALVVQAAAGVSEAYWLEWLTQGFGDRGFREAPFRTGERQANGLTWSLYTADYEGLPVGLALAEGERLTLLVVLVSDARDHAALFEAVFLPVVDALVPIH